jgi:ERCC4-type nuclease
MEIRREPGLEQPYELQLPLDDGAAGELARSRIDHLRGVSGVSASMLARLARAFPTLRAIYSASEADLARVAGPVAAARIRWFLDAPIDTRLAAELAVGPPRAYVNAAKAVATIMPTAA